jgi:eukaryotic-like serine/threonine-protein kinase
MTTPATGVVLSGRYRLTERIASGGMGTVWAAEDEVLSRRVAVKVLNEALASEHRFT